MSNSNLLIQNGCTTAFQAVLYKIPVISFVVDKNNMSHGKTANDLGTKISNKEEVKIFIEKHFAGEKFTNNKIDTLLNHKLFINKDKLSSYLINEEWFEISKNLANKK